MIVQCDQCSTKFKLDDAKLTETGVKVRCSKCRHIFVVKKEMPQEEPDLDSMLVGLEGTTASPALSVSSEPEANPSFDAAFESSFASEEKPIEGPSVAVDNDSLTTSEDAAVGFDEEPSLGNDFDFGAELPATEKVVEQPGEFDFSAFEMPQLSEPQAEPSAGLSQEFDFGEIPQEVAAQGVEPQEFSFEDHGEVAPPVVAEEPMAGEFTFEEAAAETELAPSKEEAGGEFEFSFGEQSTGLAAQEVSAELSPSGGETKDEERMEFSFTEEIPPTKEPLEKESFSFESAPAPASSTDDLSPPVTGKEEFSFERAPLAESRVTAETMAREVPNFAAADEPVPVPTVAFEPDMDEELPPLTISSRKKEGGPSSLRTILLGVLLLAVVGAGIFYYLGGMTEKNEGVPGGGAAGKGLPIEIVNVKAGYVMNNNDAGELFVVRGEAVNRSKDPRGSIQVKGAIFNKGGAVLVAQNAYCGNSLSNEQLVGMSMASIEKAMANQFGDSLANMEVKPGKSIPFTIIFAKVPADAGDFGVEIAGSAPAKTK